MTIVVVRQAQGGRAHPNPRLDRAPDVVELVRALSSVPGSDRGRPRAKRRAERQGIGTGLDARPPTA